MGVLGAVCCGLWGIVSYLAVWFSCDWLVQGAWLCGFGDFGCRFVQLVFYVTDMVLRCVLFGLLRCVCCSGFAVVVVWVACFAGLVWVY